MVNEHIDVRNRTQMYPVSISVLAYVICTYHSQPPGHGVCHTLDILHEEKKNILCDLKSNYFFVSYLCYFFFSSNKWPHVKLLMSDIFLRHVGRVVKGMSIAT